MTNINTYDYARIGGPGGWKGGPARGRGRGDMGRGRGRGSDESPSADSTAFDDISASTTISMAVPELLIGNILGKNVRHLRHLLFLCYVYCQTFTAYDVDRQYKDFLFCLSLFLSRIIFHLLIKCMD